MVTDIDPTTAPNADTAQGAATGTNVISLPHQPAVQKTSDKVIAFVKEHPGATIAGGLILGAAVSALFARKSRKSSLSSASDVTHNLLERALNLAEAAGAAGVVLGKEASERAHDATVGVRKQAGDFAGHAEKLGENAADKLEKFGLVAVAAANAIGRATARNANRLGSAAADTAHHIGEVAAEQSAKAAKLAENVKSRVK